MNSLQKQVMLDALSEYIVARAGYLAFEPGIDIAQAIEPYMRKRYRFHDEGFKAMKRTQLVERIAAAKELMKGL